MDTAKTEKTKKALVIGISGQDGAYLTRFLLDKGYDVWGTSRDAQICPFTNLYRLGVRDRVQVKSMSLNDFRSVIQVLSRIAPDEIYNLAGQTSVGLSFDQPVETFESITLGTLNLMEALRFLQMEARLFNASSSECFGNTNGEAATEETPFRPRSPYAVAKAAAFWQTSNYREAYGLFTSSGILFNHESPLRPERFVTRKIVSGACRIAQGQQDELALGNIDIQRDWGWAPDYVEAMWLTLQQKEPEDYIISTGETHSLKDFIQIIFSYLGLNWQKHVHFRSEFFRPTDILISRSHPAKAEEKLGWKAQHGITDIVRMMVEAELGKKESDDKTVSGVGVGTLKKATLKLPSSTPRKAL
jgi:GDPmannose 4,6-dehydratase